MLRITCLWACLVCIIPAVAQQDSCSALLSQGAFKITLSDGTNHTYDSAKDWFCSSDFSTYATNNKTDASLSIIIPGTDVPLGASYDGTNTSATQKRTTFCSDSSRTFSQEQDRFFLQKEGDQTIVNGYLQCVAQANLPFLKATVNSHSTGIFDVDVISQGYPGGHPLVVEVKPVSGADEVLTDDFSPGAEIPQTGSGVSPLVGTYKFQPGVQQAAVVVRTSIGSKIVTAKKCPSGTAGAYSVRQDTPHTSTVQMADFRFDFTVPQAGCHPHCGDGDQISFQQSVGLNVVLRNPRVACSPDTPRPECPLDPMGVSNIDDHTLQISGKTRTVGLPFRVTAEQWSQQTQITRDIVSTSNIQYFQPFSVSIPNNGGGDVVMNSPFGNVILNNQNLASGSLVNWLVLQGSPQPGSSDTTYTLMVKPPTCAD